MHFACSRCGKSWEDTTGDGRTRTVVYCPSCQTQINTTGIVVGVDGPTLEVSLEYAPDLPSTVQTASMDPGNCFGKYVRTQLLGEGGMGQVWKAWDAELSRWVALKVPKFDDSEELARLKAEAQAAGRLSHPNVAAIYEHGQSQGRHFIAMEYVNGVTLADYPRADRKKLVKFVREAALGVAYAHTHGIVHRDLKPVNIMVHRERDQVYVMDFGIAKQASSIKQSTSVVGTPAYMSPEQAQGERADGRSDVWALGVTLYELLADRMPFEDLSPMGTLRKIVEEEPRPLRHLDRDLATIVTKCLEKDAARRYATAQELADDLGRWAECDPITARPPSLLYVVRKKLVKRKAVLGVAVAGLLAVAISLAVLIPRWLSERAEKGALRELGTLWMQIVLAKQGLYREAVSPDVVGADIRKAMAQLDDYVRRHPRLPQAYFLRAQGRLFLDDFEAAKTDAQAAIQANEQFLPGHRLLARILLEQAVPRFSYGNSADKETPKKQFAVVVAQAERHLSLSVGRQDRAEAVEFWGLIKTPDDEVAEIVTLALTTRYVSKNKERAIAILEEARSKRVSEEYSFWLGRWAEPGEDKIRLLTEALRLKPHFPLALVDRAISYNIKGERDKAISDLTAAIKINPQLSVAWQNRGALRNNKGDAAGGIVDYSRAIELNPLDGMPYSGRGRARLNAQVRDYKGAIADCSKGIELGWDIHQCFMNRAMAHAALDDFQAAYADYAEAIRVMPVYSRAYFNLATTQAREGKLRSGVDRQSLGEKALINLRLAIEQGWYRESGGLAWTKQDEDFDWLREDPEFKRLIALPEK